jgi:N-methylhydantoinase A
LGVDVGGTFTDVVAIDAQTRALVARVKVPTTHDARDGVAAGIVTGIERILRESGVRASDVAFIAHSTTQATNALLEGDVARVGVIGLVPRAGWLARAQMRFRPVALAPGFALAPRFSFVAIRDSGALAAALASFERDGVEAVAVSRPFGVDRPEDERAAVEAAQRRGLLATSGHDVTSMYGLRARTRTAALNAAILPKMVRTAEMTRGAVERAAIAAPLMIMRSDGGVMDVREVFTRPILTMLSGPAAGVAGALLYENVTDGIFLEVGGTSVDCSAIRGGRPQMRPARIGGHRTMLNTIDSRTLGIAGGSMPRIGEREIVDVGPRSAHIAGCRYAAFCDESEFDGARLERFSPGPNDPPDYLRFALRDGGYATVTPTCASNLLGFVPGDAFAKGNAAAARAAFDRIAREFGGSAETHATRLLELAAVKVRACIDELIADYDLPREQTVLVGGGGAAAALVPLVAQRYGFEHRIARDAEVISPIGVALALVRDVVERTIVGPTPADIAALRREASDRVIAAGASPERVEVVVEIDAQRHRVRATASGSTASADAAAGAPAGETVRAAAAARSLGCDAGALDRTELTGPMTLYRHGRDQRIVDERGVVRLALRDASLTMTTAGEAQAAIRDAIESATRFGDVGRSLPELYVVRGSRVAAFEGFADAEQGVALACEELEGCASLELVAVLTLPRSA